METQVRLNRTIILLVLASLALTSSCTPQINPQVTFSQPKIYTDEYLTRVLSERRNNLRDINKTIKASEIQEIFGVRQAGRFDAQTSVQPSTGGAVSAPQPISSGNVVLPEKPVAAAESLGRRHADILRDHITRDHDLTTWEALHDLDSTALNNGKRLALIRIDVYINNYPRPQSNDPHFVRTDFKIDCKPAACSVYYLSPEKSSVVAQESLASSFLENYAGQIGAPVQGVDVAAAARFQRQLEESLLSVVEQPIEYAIYERKNEDDKTARFAFAFGPRRRIERRGVYNPARWFGQTYTFDYEIGPGPRDVYALVLMPCDTTDMTIYATSSRTVLDKNEVGTPISPTKNMPKIGEAKFMPACQPTLDAFPDYIYPKLTNTIYLTSDKPILPQSEVMIGPERVPDGDVVRVDRYRIRVTLKPSKALLATLREQDTAKHRATVSIFRPGVGVTTLKTLTLKDSESPEKVTLSIKPDKGKVRREVVISTSDPELFNMKTIVKIKFGGTDIEKKDFLNQTERQLTVTAPDLKAETDPEVNIRIYSEKDGKPQEHEEHMKTFQYVK
jgi:hypothetical protein